MVSDPILHSCNLADFLCRAGGLGLKVEEFESRWWLVWRIFLVSRPSLFLTSSLLHLSDFSLRAGGLGLKGEDSGSGDLGGLHQEELMAAERCWCGSPVPPDLAEESFRAHCRGGVMVVGDCQVCSWTMSTDLGAAPEKARRIFRFFDIGRFPFSLRHFFAVHGWGCDPHSSREGMMRPQSCSAPHYLRWIVVGRVTAPEKAFGSPQTSQQFRLLPIGLQAYQSLRFSLDLPLLVVSSGLFFHPVVPCVWGSYTHIALLFFSSFLSSVRPHGWTIALLLIFSVLAFRLFLSRFCLSGPDLVIHLGSSCLSGTGSGSTAGHI